MTAQPESAGHPVAPAQLRVAVVGAGIVGSSTALLLAQAGHRVELLDPRGVCGATSFGNAGGVHIGAIQPFAAPGVLWQALRMLADPVGPLMIDGRYLPRALPWFRRFLRNATDARMRAGAAATASINHHAVAAWQDIAGAAGAAGHLHAVGWLKIYDREEDFRHGARERALMEENGFPFEVLEGAALRALEPSLGPAVLRGMWQPDSLFIDNPGRVVQRIAEAAIGAGAVLHCEAVRDIRLRDSGCELETGERLLQVDRVVVAAGAWSAPLAARLGHRVPLEAERGYHLMLPHPARRPARPIMYPRRRFVICPMEEGLRLTACVEFAGLERGPDYRRIERLLPFVASILPGLDERIESRWLGYRPSLPDSLPVIDSAGAGRVIFAFGHGHLGMTQGPATARAVTALLEGRPAPFALAPFRISRFARD